jgi:hypothetical protein
VTTTLESSESTSEASSTQESSVVRSMISMAQHAIQLVSYIEIICDLEIFFDALEKGHYKSFLGPKSYLPMIYIDDCIDATV